MKLFVASMSLLFGLSRLAHLSAGSASPAPASRSAESSAVRSVEDTRDEGSYTCPRVWVCDHTEVYDTRAACLAACSGVCEVEVFCDGFCVCP